MSASILSAASADPGVPDWFDAAFYLEQNPDVAGAAEDAYLHFREQGWREFRNPSPGFDLWWYQAMHLDGDHARDPVAHYLASGRAAALDTTHAAEKPLEVARKTQFNLRSLALLDALAGSSAVLARVAANLARMSLWDVADMFAVRACSLSPDVAAHHLLLAAILRKRGGWRRALDPLRAAIAIDPSRAESFHELGYAYERLDLVEQATLAYRSALALEPRRTDTLFRLGRLLEQQGLHAEAGDTYAPLSALMPDVAAMGVGILHQSEHDWISAEAAYRARLRDARHAADARLLHAHGFSLEMLFQWEDAATAHARALREDPTEAAWHYRLGHVLERLQRYAEAAAAYADALALREDPDWRYRRANCLLANGDSTSAIADWLQSVSRQTAHLSGDEPAGLQTRRLHLEDRVRRSAHPAGAYFELGTICERMGHLEDAASAYRQATLRRDDHDPADHFRLGSVLHRLGRDGEACRAFRDTRLFKRDYAHVPRSQPLDIKNEYAEFIDTLAVDPCVILYESFHGDSVGCNPLAVFRMARERFAGRGCLHVWAVKPDAAIPEAYAGLEDVVFVRHGSTLYARYLATAGWLVNNNTFMPYFVRRPDQRYLNTWHGTPLKKLGIEIPGALLEHRNATRNLLQATHITVPNRHTQRVLLEAYQVGKVVGAQVALTGQQRVDLLLNPDQDARARLRARLGLSADQRVMLYAPTWRGDLQGPTIDDRVVGSALERMVGTGATVLFSAHHLLTRSLGPLPAGVSLVQAGTDINELMSIVDVLVTDYSSILFDFLPTRRPVIQFVPDVEQYERERGLYLDLQTLSTRVCHTLDQLDAGLQQSLDASSADTGREAAIARFCPQEDGEATLRTLAFFFDGDRSDVVDTSTGQRTRLLFQVDNFNPNGITTSFNRLVSALDHEQVSVSLIVDPWGLESYPQRLERYAELPAHVQRWGRISYPVGTPEEQWLNHRQTATREPLGARAQRLLDGFYVREYQRQFGSSKLDAVVIFSGYSSFWATVFARGRPEGIRSVIYLHNDMRRECALKYPQLVKVFAQYPHFDALVSVSDSLGEVNADSFAGAGADRFQVVENCIDPAWIREGALAPLPAGFDAWAADATLIGTVGRLSPEKGHLRLLDAFHSVWSGNRGLKLVITGDGPERQALVDRIGELGLQDAVRLTGGLYNPYPLMRRLDLFVLPSLHEGQGIVLLEALTVGTPVMATRIPGPASVLADGAGMLVDSSVDGLVSGLQQWLQERAAAPSWDADAYCRRSIEQFMRVVAVQP